MCRVLLLWRKVFLLSMFVVFLLSFWIGISRYASKFDVLFVKGVLFESGKTKSDRQEHGARETSSASNHLNPAQLRIEPERKLPVADLSNYFTGDKVEGTEHQNGSNWMAELQDSTKPTFNRDKPRNLLLENETLFPLLSTGNVKPAKIPSVSLSLKPNLSSGKSHSSKQSLDIYTHAVKKSVYGEPGCPDNPWREDLSDLIRTWDKIAKENNIEYVLACGSLLGAMRNGDVIPYDSDIDILMDINYFAGMKRLSVERNFDNSDGNTRLVIQPEFHLNIPVDERKRFDCQGKETPLMIDGCSFQEPMARLIKGDLHIDFFHFYDRVHTIEDPCVGRLKEYSKKDFYPFRSCSFMGLDASCPNNPWEILRIYFKTDNFEPIYKCKNGTWVDKEGFRAYVF